MASTWQKEDPVRSFHIEQEQHLEHEIASGRTPISSQSRPLLRASNHELLIDGMDRLTELNDQQTARNVRDIGRPPSCSRAWAELEAISLWTHNLQEPGWSIDGTAVFWKTSGRTTALRECSVRQRWFRRFCTL
jgi:hypothetical protein